MSTTPSSSSTTTLVELYDVIVIGAGISGLAAARLLHSKGLKVIVLEARDRIGGRLWTNKSSFSVPVDMGGSWIHGTGGGNPLTQLAKDHSIVTEKTDYENCIVYNEQGHELTDSIEEKYEASYKKLFKSVLQTGKDRMKAHLPDISLGEAFRDCRSRLHNTTLSESKYVDLTIKSEIEYEYASNIDQMSLRMFETDEEFPGPDAVFHNGYNQITDVLAAALNSSSSGCIEGNNSTITTTSSSSSSKIHLQCVVHRLVYASDSSDQSKIPADSHSRTRCDCDTVVEVHTSKGVFRGTRAVVTLPLGVLRTGSVQFEPPLPPSKLAVIHNKMHMGLACKVFLEFPTVFWPRNHVFHLISPDSDRHLDVFNMHAYNKGAGKILMVYYGGFQAKVSESMSEEALVNEIMSHFRSVWGVSIPAPSKCLKTRWGSDPYSLGAYSYAGVGAVPEDYRELAATVAGCLYFAGEATSRDYIATAAGAFLSGESAAKRILADN